MVIFLLHQLFYIDQFICKNYVKVKIVKMKQWIVIVKSPSKYDLGRLDLNMRPLNYVALWTIGTTFYRYYEFLDHVTEKVLKNIFKLGDRVTISPVKIWERRHHLDDETISLCSFKEAGEMT